ncbi:MAG: GNAT family N-acetyltransferase [Pseudomonadales bacterium]|nr:GNAT family N-acetyltransferase [Pseudomonadales bacterium]
MNIDAYAVKLTENAARFEAYHHAELVGLVAAYCNDDSRRVAHISNVSVLRQWQGKGVAQQLLRTCLQHAMELGFERIELQVGVDSAGAIRLYARAGFRRMETKGPFVQMRLDLGKTSPMEDNRDYNREIRDTPDHQYAYGFDFDVMHPYMIRSFEPFFNRGSLLELGSFKGDFTRRFLSHFDDVTCVEASGEAIEQARARLGGKVVFVHARFEDANLTRRYDNIVLTHVLEHLDDPVAVLRRVNEEWLADGGRLFLVCPNANAPSRQIAVKMGLISHNAAVTKAEAEHGHRCTYSLDTLERDAVAADLKVVHRSGIFFKALANFQWDRLLSTDIISKEYLDGCYKLGQQYPDLCSSIFLMCERGDVAVQRSS